MGAEDLQGVGRRGVGVKIGPFDELDRAICMAKFAGVKEKCNKLAIEIGEFEFFAKLNLLGERGVWKERDKKGDEGGFTRVIFGWG